MKVGALVAVAVLLATACGSTPTTGTKHRVPPTATMKPLDKVGTGEGTLNLIAWEGYVDDSWKKSFKETTGCQVSAKYAGSSDEMLTLKQNRGDGQGEFVTASGAAGTSAVSCAEGKAMWKQAIPRLVQIQ